jgi:hypothetical protein
LVCSPCRATDRRSFSSSSADHRSDSPRHRAEQHIRTIYTAEAVKDA